MRKTCFRRACKYLPLSPDFASAIERADTAEYGERAGDAARTFAGEVLEVPPTTAPIESNGATQLRPEEER